MSYTDGLDNPELHFQSKLYAGNSTTRSITFDGSENMQPDWVWIKERDDAINHYGYDSVRGVDKRLQQNISNAESDTDTTWFRSFDSNGFSIGTEDNINDTGDNYVAWNWKAGGSAPAITYVVKVVSDSGNKYRFDDFGTSAVTLDLQEGGTYTFDLSDSSNDGHPMKFSETSNGSHGGGSTYSTGIVYQLDGASVTESNYVSNFNSASSRKIIITVAASAPTLYYFCHYHSGMGGQANTNSTFGSSNFSGSIQTVVSANQTAGFSIIKYPGNSTNSTIGHGIGTSPSLIIFKETDGAESWRVHHTSLPNNTTNTLSLNSTSASFSQSNWISAISSSTISIGTDSSFNTSGNNYIAYAFSKKKAYSSIGSYIGNGNSSDGTFIYTGFRPAFVFYKNTTTADSWFLHDNKRQGFNDDNELLFADLSQAEATVNRIRILSNGFKAIDSDKGVNKSGDTYIYWAIAEQPFVNSNGVPNNAR